MRLLRQEYFSGEKTLVRILAGCLLLSRMVLLIVLYVVASEEGRLAWPYIGVTSTYSKGSGRAIAAFFLPLSAMMSSTILSLRLRRISFILHTQFQWFLWWVMVGGTVLLTLGLFGLGSVPPSTNSAVSYVFGTMWYIGSITSIVLGSALNRLVALVQPVWLGRLRLGVAVLVVLLTLLLAVTIGWLPGPASVIEIVLAQTVVLYYATFSHGSEFPIRSNCVFAYPASVPPLPIVPEHSLLILKEVDV